MITENSTEEEKEEFFREFHKKTDAFNLALGRFVGIFSMVETHLQTHLWQFAGVSSPTAQAIFGGMRVDGAMQLINRIADAQKWDEAKKSEISYLFSQLGMINRMRNDVLHYGADFDHSKNSWVVTNKQFVHIPERIQETRIDPQSLSDATFDLIRINFRLLLLTYGDADRAFLAGALKNILEGAWRYKPPVPDRASRKNRTTPRKRPRQPRPSSK